MFLPILIKDLAFILIAAAFASILFKKLRQPVVLGYLVAGLFVGPHFPSSFSVQDQNSIAVWAELGIVFLMFGVGLEFSFKKLSHVGLSSGMTAIIETVGMFFLGYLVGRAFNWTTIESLFLGGTIAISSTTIIVKSIEELGLKGRDFVNFVFGILVVEDLIAILILMFLSTLGMSQDISFSNFAYVSMSLVLFLVGWFLAGIYLIPHFFINFAEELSDEIIVLVSLGLCLFMVVMATTAGFSTSLGAFIMGSIFAETRERKRIEHLIVPIKKLFMAIFFVSVGMMINPKLLFVHYKEVVLLSLIVIFGKIFFVLFAGLLSGQRMRGSVQTAFSIFPIGEFSFVLVTLGMRKKLTGDFLYPVIVGVSALTIFAVPYFMVAAENISHKLEYFFPIWLKNKLEDYQSAMNSRSEKGPIKLLWDAYGVRIALNTIVVLVFSLIFRHVIYIAFRQYFSEDFWPKLICLGAAFFATAPFFWGIFFASPDKNISHEFAAILKLNNLLFGLTIFRLLIGTILVGILIGQFVDFRYALLASFVMVVTTLYFFKSVFEVFYKNIEIRFMKNLNDKEKKELEKRKKVSTLAPWDAIMAEFEVAPNSVLCGKTLLNSKLKEKFNLTVALIERGNKKIVAPNRETMLMAFDRIHLIGAESELMKVREFIEERDKDDFQGSLEAFYKLESILLSPKSIFANKSIRDCGIREKIDGLIVGLERDGKRYLSPDSQMVLRPQDLLWVVGDIRKIKLKKEDY